jgi:hypothetical protein
MPRHVRTWRKLSSKRAFGPPLSQADDRHLWRRPDGRHAADRQETAIHGRTRRRHLSRRAASGGPLIRGPRTAQPGDRARTDERGSEPLYHGVGAHHVFSPCLHQAAARFSGVNTSLASAKIIHVKPHQSATQVVALTGGKLSSMRPISARFPRCRCIARCWNGKGPDRSSAGAQFELQSIPAKAIKLRFQSTLSPDSSPSTLPQRTVPSFSGCGEFAHRAAAWSETHRSGKPRLWRA